MLNQTVLVGRLTEDPTVTIMENNKKISSVTLAVQRPFKNANGEYETDFFPVAIWTGIAETTSQYCRKGDLIGVKGRLQSKDNVISIIAERITFLSSKSIKDDISTEKELKI